MGCERQPFKAPKRSSLLSQNSSVARSLKRLETIVGSATPETSCASVVIGGVGVWKDEGLRRLFVHSDDARLLAVARLRYQLLEFELLSILARLSPTPDVSVSVRSTRSMLSEYAATKIR